MLMHGPMAIEWKKSRGQHAKARRPGSSTKYWSLWAQSSNSEELLNAIQIWNKTFLSFRFRIYSDRSAIIHSRIAHWHRFHFCKSIPSRYNSAHELINNWMATVESSRLHRSSFRSLRYGRYIVVNRDINQLKKQSMPTVNNNNNKLMNVNIFPFLRPKRNKTIGSLLSEAYFFRVMVSFVSDDSHHSSSPYMPSFVPSCTCSVVIAKFEQKCSKVPFTGGFAKQTWLNVIIDPKEKIIIFRDPLHVQTILSRMYFVHTHDYILGHNNNNRDNCPDADQKARSFFRF